MAADLDRELVSDLAEDDDLDSLFGGDDDDLSSLFTEDAGASEPSIELRESESEATLLTPHSSPPEAANPSFQLTLPTPSSAKQNKTPELTPPLPLSLPQRPSQAEAKEHIPPTIPDPLGAFLLCRDGHTSGDPVVSTQNSAQTSLTATPSPSLPDEATFDALLDEIWASISNDAQVVNHPPEPSNGVRRQHGEEISHGDASGVSLDQLPDFRYANVSTTRHLRLPRSIDHSSRTAELLVPYITLSRESKPIDLYKALELDVRAGKKLRKEIKVYLETSPFSVLVEEKRGGDILATKKTLTNAAFHILVSEGWGTKWFGPSCETALNRRLFWAADSTLLLVHFVRLLNKVIYHTRQVRCRNERAAGDRPASTQASTPSRSSSVFTPSVYDTSGRSASVSTPSVSTPSVYGTTGSAVTRLSTQDSRPLLDSLVKTVVSTKRKRPYSVANPTYELEVPNDAKLTYCVYTRDQTDGSELGPPATYRHNDSAITHGVFSYLKGSLEAAGHSPVFEILTPYGVRTINSEEDWDQAVVSIYNRRRSGAQVEVDIFV